MGGCLSANTRYRDEMPTRNESTGEFSPANNEDERDSFVEINSQKDELTKEVDRSEVLSRITLDDHLSVSMRQTSRISLSSTLAVSDLLSGSTFIAHANQVILKTENPKSTFCFHQQLGKGGLCRVYMATKMDQPGRRFAVRVVPANSQERLLKAKQQIAMMRMCECSNVMRYYFTYLFCSEIYMFVEYMDKGCLATFISKYAPLSENIIAYITRQCLAGLSVIHSKNQIHRDLKSDNILLNSEGSVKIGDFGQTLQLTKSCGKGLGIAGTPSWMAPQVVVRNSYTASADIWSLGVIIYEMVHRQPPFAEAKPVDTMRRVISEPSPCVQGSSKELSDLVAFCLQKDPTKRPQTRWLLKQPFFSKAKQGLKELLNIINPERNSNIMKSRQSSLADQVGSQ